LNATVEWDTAVSFPAVESAKLWRTR